MSTGNLSWYDQATQRRAGGPSQSQQRDSRSWSGSPPGECSRKAAEMNGLDADPRGEGVQHMHEHLIIIWTDTEPVEDGLVDAARAQGGQVLAAGPVHHVSELDSRPAPAGLVITRFGAAENARS